MRAGLATATKLLAWVLIFGALFVTAGTFGYWRGWAFLATFAVSTAAPTIYLLSRNRQALQRRLKVGHEARTTQRVVTVLLSVFALAMVVFSVLDFRLGWSSVPWVVSVIGNAVLAVGMVLSVAVVFQNEYAAANVTVEEGQKVVTTGYYRIVRHPMYLFALIGLLGIPLALGSWWGMLFLVPLAIVLTVRAGDEEKLLEKELDGYADYMRQTRFRIVPYAW